MHVCAVRVLGRGARLRVMLYGVDARARTHVSSDAHKDGFSRDLPAPHEQTACNACYQVIDLYRTNTKKIRWCRLR